MDKNLFKSQDYCLGWATEPRPPPSKDYSGISSSQALLAAQSEHMEKLSPAAKLHMVMELLGGEEECPTCGTVKETGGLITPEQAMKLLGFGEEE